MGVGVVFAAIVCGQVVPVQFNVWLLSVQTNAVVFAQVAVSETLAPPATTEVGPEIDVQTDAPA